MRADTLLDEIEPLRYSRRCRRLADLRSLAGTPELRALLEELDGRGYHERGLALFIATAVRDEASLEQVGRALRDPAFDLALGAVSWAVRLGLPAERLEELLADAPAAIRAAAYEAIRRHRRRDLAERLIDQVAGRWGDREAAALLPACGGDAARARLDGLAHAVANWKAFALSHPDAMLDFAEHRLPGVPGSLLSAWWRRHGTGVAAAVPHDPGRVIALLERHCPAGPLPYELNGRLGILLDAEPDRALRLLLAEEHRQGLAWVLRRRLVRDRLRRLGDPEAAEVARAVRDDAATLALLLNAYPPSRRDAIHAAAMAGTDLATAEHDERVMEVLPWAARAREARRMLGLTRVAGDPHRLREVASFLPYDEARPVLYEVTRRPDADDRAAGYRLLVRCAGRSRDPEVLTRLLDDLDRLRNEQDPVRMHALSALAAVPTALLRAGHAAALIRLAGDALGARDCSYATRRYLMDLATGLCRQGAIGGDAGLLRAGLDMLDTLTGRGGPLPFPPLAGVLRRGQEHDLVRTLARRLSSAERRDDHRLALALARALGRRAYGVPALQDALEKALDARDDGDIRAAAGLWLADPRTRAERVERVLAKDPSMIVLPRVFAAVARERTDLLRPVLDGRVPAGRFQRPDVAHVPSPERSWMRRWTAKQRAAYLRLLHRLARDEGATDSARAQAVRSIGTVPGVGTGELRPYLDSAEPLLRRAGLTSAVWVASPQEVLPRLLDLASSDDAHVALYAATRAARFVAPSTLHAALAPVIADGKITARKEALRILLRDHAPDAMGAVAAAWDDPGQHRDVRAAIASAVRERLGDPVAMRILAEAARGPRDLALQVTGVSPVAIEERHRPAYAALIMDVARSADREAVCEGLYSLQQWVPWARDAAALLASHLTALDDTLTWRAALNSLRVCGRAGHGLAELGTAAEELAAAAAAPDAGAERDRPAWQRLTALVESVRLDHGREGAAAIQPLVRALTGRLPEPLASELLAATIPWDAPGTETDLDALADRPTGPTFAVLRVARSLANGRYVGDLDAKPQRVHNGPLNPAAEVVLPHAERLAARAGLAPGLFAYALTAHHGELTGWPEPWRDVLRRLRAHPHPDVAYMAGTVRTATE
ncbi:hypothetical protein [Spirillospora sp. NPDC029432]|uniref:hypothetical protein n=1 Tax=Spirillospora sp. NPDC029432 TaxID=3154599 RepID=UPI003455EEAC